MSANNKHRGSHGTAKHSKLLILVLDLVDILQRSMLHALTCTRYLSPEWKRRSADHHHRSGKWQWDPERPDRAAADGTYARACRQTLKLKFPFDHINKVDLQNRPVPPDGRQKRRNTCGRAGSLPPAPARYLGLPSEEAFKGRGVSASGATCDGFFYRTESRGRRRQKPAVEEAPHRANIALKCISSRSTVAKPSAREDPDQNA